MTTLFLPLVRAGAADIAAQAALFAPETPQRQMLDVVPNGLVVLNPQRQIVYANEAFCRQAGKTLDALLGARIGEALACIYSELGDDGCGTSAFCSSCGAARAQRRALDGVAAVEECRIRREVGAPIGANGAIIGASGAVVGANGANEATSAADGATGAATLSEAPLELRVWAEPLAVEGTRFMVFALADISHEKRRHLLERIFFHDLGNTAGFIRGTVEMLALRQNGSQDAEMRLFTQRLQHAAERLLDEIEGQRQLRAAEDNSLQLATASYSSLALLREQVAFYAAHPVAARRVLRLSGGSDDVPVALDGAVLGRVLGNMIKNALEACRPGEVVTAGCRARGAVVQFWVHNPGVMAPAVQHQIFQRTFSTRSPDRGLGTYSMKLLAEAYLGGTVRFTSTPERGTVFVVAGDWGSGLGDRTDPP